MANGLKIRFITAVAVIVFLSVASMGYARLNVARLGSSGVDLAGMDRSVKPGDDFNRYVNGRWEARTTVPPAYSVWGSFTALATSADRDVREALETTAPALDASSNLARQVYASFMNESEVEKRSPNALQSELSATERYITRADISEALGRAGREGVSTALSVGVTLDAKDPKAYVVEIAQGPLGLPDRGYYFQKGRQYELVRRAYRNYLSNILRLAGIDHAESKGLVIFDLEAKIAKTQWSQRDNQDDTRLYNPVAVSDLRQAYPGIEWKELLRAAHLSTQSRVVVRQSGAVRELARLMSSEPIESWRLYLAYRTIASRMDVLPEAFAAENFKLSQALAGSRKIEPRWKRGVTYVNARLGDAVGKMYVARHFTPDAKRKVEEIASDVLRAMRARIKRTSWMDKETKGEALGKLANITIEVGYPDSWREYEGLSINQSSLYENELRICRFLYDREVKKLESHADRREWFLMPQSVNASANPYWNTLVFPAAILQPPFFDPNADDAVNYGAIGAVIGHELSHLFDDQGSRFDANGMLRDWWTAGDRRRFTELTKKLEEQYGAHEPLPGVRLNALLTSAENVADLAGINVAYDAWRLSAHISDIKESDGFTGNQRFFLGFAQMWRTKFLPQALREALIIDPHSPGNIRVSVVRNVDAWYEAFGVQQGQKEYLPSRDRVKIW